MRNITRKMRRIVIMVLCMALVVPGVDISAAMNEIQNAGMEESSPTEETESTEESSPTEEAGSTEETESTEESFPPGGIDSTGETESTKETESTEETESVEETLPIEETEPTEAAFYEEMEVGRFHILVSAPEGVFPEGAVLNVEEVKGKGREIKTAVEGEISADIDRVDTLAAFDITIVDQNGIELQPDNSMGEVSVVFRNIDTDRAERDEDADIQVFHIADDYQSATAMETEVKEEEVAIEAPHFSRYAVMLMVRGGAKEVNGFELKDFLKETVLMSGNPLTKVEDGSEVSLTGDFSLRFYFNTIDADSSVYIGEEAYELADLSGDLPEGLALKESINLPMTWSVLAQNSDSNSFTLGTATLQEDKKLVFQFNLTEKRGDIVGQELQNIFIDCSCMLDSNVIGKEQSYEIDLTSLSGGSVTIKPAENQKKDPSIEKKGTYDTASSKITWKVTIDPGKNHPEDTAFYFIDDLGTDEKFGDNDSFQIGDVDRKGDDKFRFADNVLKYEINIEEYPEEQDITITYTTTPTGLTSDNKIATAAYQVKNEAKIKDGLEGADVATSGIVTAEIPETKYIDKEATGTELAEDGQIIIDWKITIKANGHSLGEVTLYDKIPENFSYVAGSIRLNGQSTEEPSADVGAEGGKPYNFKYEFDPTIGSDQTITYQTKSTYDGLTPENDYYKNNYAPVKNQAWITIPLFDGIEPSSYDIGPVEKEGGGSAMISKSGTYHPENNQIEWTITVNKNNAHELTNVSVTDIIPADQEYVANSVTVDGMAKQDSGLKLSGEESKHIEIPLENIDKGTTVTIKLNTKIIDPLNYTNDTGKVYENQATLKSDGVTDLSVEGIVTCNSNMIEKEQVAYDHNTHAITWKVTVNSNKAVLTNAKVEDVFDEGLSLVPDSVKVNDANISNSEDAAGTKPYYSYTPNPGDEQSKLTLFLQDVSDEGMGKDEAVMTVTYQTLVDLEHSAFDGKFSNTQNKVPVSNTAAFTSGNSDKNPSVTASYDVPNERMNKKGTYPASAAEKDMIQYTVYINKNQVTIPDRTTVTDTLSKGLELSLSSVELKRASVNEGGGMTAGDSITPKQLSYAMNDDGGSTMTLVLPDNSEKTAYILTYKAVVDMEAGVSNYTNGIKLGGTDGGVNGFSDISKSEIQSNGGGGQSVPKSKVKIVKQDPQGSGLKDAVFALLQKGLDGSYVECKARKTTGENGEVTFVGLDVGAEYAVQEISAPEGYVLDSNLRTFTAPARGQEEEITVVNQEKKADTGSTPNTGNSGSGSDSDDSGNNSRLPSDPSVPQLQVAYLPGYPNAITEAEMIKEVMDVFALSDAAEKKRNEAGLRIKVMAILEQNPEFFKNASHELQEYILELIREEEIPMAVMLPKTGEDRWYRYRSLLCMMLMLCYMEEVLRRRRKRDRNA